MNKAKRAKWCNPVEGVGTEEGGLRFTIIKRFRRRRRRVKHQEGGGRGGGGGGPGGRIILSPPRDGLF